MSSYEQYLKKQAEHDAAWRAAEEKRDAEIMLAYESFIDWVINDCRSYDSVDEIKMLAQKAADSADRAFDEWHETANKMLGGRK